MHILIEGTMAKVETKNAEFDVDLDGSLFSDPLITETRTTLPTRAVPVIVPKDVITQEAYKIIVDSREITLGCIDCASPASPVYYCNGPGFNLTLTEKVYNELVRTLNRLNIEEALLLNALMIEKKKDVKDIKEIDLWSKQKVNALLGIKLDE